MIAEIGAIALPDRRSNPEQWQKTEKLTGDIPMRLKLRFAGQGF